MVLQVKALTQHAGWRRGWVGMLASMALACGVADEGKLPPDVQDPTTLRTPAGALARYRGALAELPGAFDQVLTLGGILTDELAALPISVGTFGAYTNLDSRRTKDLFLSADLSTRLHRLRAQAREARGFLKAYASDKSPALQGHMHALEGYAEVFLADLFCSGIPLSTVDFDGNYTLATGSSTADVYRHAIMLFDSALALTADSVPFQRLAAIGLARAHLALGHYDSAATAVASVPTDYVYRTTLTFLFVGDAEQTFAPDSAALWWYATRGTSQLFVGAPGMADEEGGNGLDYRSSGDLRTAFVARGEDLMANTYFFPAKYALSSPVTLTVADGLEARLIEAEAALKVGDGRWLTLLNELRPRAGLPSDLTDPGTAAARVNLLFRERAFWLYLTGHRQGDLRRLIRQYQRLPDEVYPTGPYSGGREGSYGLDVVLPVSSDERILNPKYTGCINSNA